MHSFLKLTVTAHRLWAFADFVHWERPGRTTNITLSAMDIFHAIAPIRQTAFIRVQWPTPLHDMPEKLGLKNLGWVVTLLQLQQLRNVGFREIISQVALVVTECTLVVLAPVWACLVLAQIQLLDGFDDCGVLGGPIGCKNGLHGGPLCVHDIFGTRVHGHQVF